MLVFLYYEITMNYAWLETLADPRVASWPLLRSPGPTLCIVIFYLIIVFGFAPLYMRNRDAYKFNIVLPLYNFTLSIFNFYILEELFVGSYNAGYSYICTPLRMDSYDSNEIRIAKAIWLYYISKIVELLDTVIFALRKRESHISFLHLYHHITMPMLWWIGTKWQPGGQSCVAVMLNSCVHVVMYIYYGMAALGPKYRKYLWWKKYLTLLQLIQFAVGILYVGTSLYVECPVPVWMHWASIFYCTSLIILFSDFYVKAYKKQRNVVNNNSTKTD